MSSFAHLGTRYGRSANGSLDFPTTQTTVTLITSKGDTYTTFVRRIIVWIETDAAQSITFQDSASAPVVIAKVTTSPGADTRWDFDFGERGATLTAGKNLVAAFSAAGLAGHMEWYAYQRLTTAA